MRHFGVYLSQLAGALGPEEGYGRKLVFCYTLALARVLPLDTQGDNLYYLPGVLPTSQTAD